MMNNLKPDHFYWVKVNARDPWEIAWFVSGKFFLCGARDPVTQKDLAKVGEMVERPHGR